MATVTGFTAARMLDIENSTIVDGHIDGDDLVLVTRDDTEIVAGNVRGPQGFIGPAADIGDIKASIRTALDGWLIMGTNHVNADSLYPDLWAVVPAAWKSGTTLNLPAMSNRVLEGGGTLGASTGATTATILAANLPPHVHTETAHTHTVAAHVHAQTSHTHSINHDHGSINSGYISNDHSHWISMATLSAGAHNHGSSVPFVYQGGPSGFGLQSGSPNYAPLNVTFPQNVESTDVAHQHYVQGWTEGVSANHYHSVNVPTFSGTSGGASAVNTASAGSGNTGSSSGGNTGNGPGTSTPISIEQQALRVNFFIYAG
jgi:hypothetical protein